MPRADSCRRDRDDTPASFAAKFPRHGQRGIIPIRETFTPPLSHPIHDD
jgi:hypothetical protein